MCFLAGHGDVEVPATLAGSVSRSVLDCCSLEFRTHAHRHATAQVKEPLRMSWQDVMISSCAQAFPPPAVIHGFYTALSETLLHT